MLAQIDIMINTMPFFDDLKPAVQQSLIDYRIDSLPHQSYLDLINLFVREFDAELVYKFSTVLHKVSYSELRAFKQANMHSLLSLKRSREEIAVLEGLDASVEDLVRKVQLATDVSGKLKELKDNLKQAIVAGLFDKLADECRGLESTKHIFAALNKLKASDFALIISACVDDIVESDWIISLRLDDSYFQKSIQAAEDVVLQEGLENLKWFTNGIYDNTLMSISDSPKFYLNNSENWRILDAGMVDLELKSNISYRNIIQKIDAGQTGVDYVLKNLPSNSSPGTLVLDRLLRKWSDNFISLPNAVINMYEQMLMLNDHDRLLSFIDEFFEDRIQKKLPENIKKLPCLKDLQRSLTIKQRTYDAFSEEIKALPQKVNEQTTLIDSLQRQKSEYVDLNNILGKRKSLQQVEEFARASIDKQLLDAEAELTTLKERAADVTKVLADIANLERQIEHGEQQRSAINIDDLAIRVGNSSAHYLRVERDKGTKWAQIFFVEEDSIDRYFSSSELKSLVKQYIEELQSREWVKWNVTMQGALAAHLLKRRSEQNEMRTNAEGSLRTNPNDGSDPHVLTPTEVRDGLNRNAYIDTAIADSAEDFRDIIIAANILVYGGGDSGSMLESINNRNTTRRVLAERNRASHVLKQQYSPNSEEIIAQHLEAIDNFVGYEVKFGNRGYIEMALKKLQDFLIGETLQLSELQLGILSGSRIPALASTFIKRQNMWVNGCSESLSIFGFNKIRKHPDTCSSAENDANQHRKKATGFGKLTQQGSNNSHPRFNP